MIISHGYRILLFVIRYRVQLLKQKSVVAQFRIVGNVFMVQRAIFYHQTLPIDRESKRISDQIVVVDALFI